MLRKSTHVEADDMSAIEQITRGVKSILENSQGLPIVVVGREQLERILALLREADVEMQMLRAAIEDLRRLVDQQKKWPKPIVWWVVPQGPWDDSSRGYNR